jgi:hypothetical protein
MYEMPLEHRANGSRVTAFITVYSDVSICTKYHSAIIYFCWGENSVIRLNVQFLKLFFFNLQFESAIRIYIL